ncbi:MAG: hypothetical protein KDD53_06335 [Bdellovibrionales bacterium]|nr:hypothetical protein [Bdellovibrionales bacterium]
MAQTNSASDQDSKKKSAKERAFERLDLESELKLLEALIADLKVQYEQYFLGIRELAPEKLHRETKLQIKKLIKAPFKSATVRFRLRTLESRYHTFNNYWQRTLKQREEGVYRRDVFKAELREKIALEEASQGSAASAANKSLEGLFQSYKSALEKQTGKRQDIDFSAFRKSLVSRAKDFKEKHGVKKVSFKVQVKEGKVSLKAEGVK